MNAQISLSILSCAALLISVVLLRLSATARVVLFTLLIAAASSAIGSHTTPSPGWVVADAS
jgi:hypothetical protein